MKINNINLGIFMDITTCIIIVLFIIGALVISGLFKDFLNAFKMISKNSNEYSENEISRSKDAIFLSIFVSILAGIVGSILRIIILFQRLSDPSSLGPSMTMGLLFLLYSAIFVLILLPIGIALKNK